MALLPFADILISHNGDVELQRLADRHYSRKHKGAKKFVGPGKSIVLRNPAGTWLFVWRKCKYRQDNQVGWECSIFRNESKEKSSDIILKCEKYISGRVFTYINPNKIKSKNPGYCFLMAGWKKAGKNKSGKLLIFSKELGLEVEEVEKDIKRLWRNSLYLLREEKEEGGE